MEKDENIIRYLEVWLNSKIRIRTMIQKAKEFVKQMTRSLNKLLYIQKQKKERWIQTKAIMTNEKIIDRIVKKMEKEVILSTLPNLKDEEDEKKNLEIPLLNYGSQPENIDSVVENKLINRLKRNLSYAEKDLVFYMNGSCKIEHKLDLQELEIE
ncbi:hypothetical protein C2G38_2155996 [Gigaspora rosea]|uniref:Uncharacterized protein n=1 Tax=Gigaspora rosea TaxID=44941 RepID=A0A397W762_9GLOM|nr:hypothetical protein C2G38_2155996 [Gigaspora rosea]